MTQFDPSEDTLAGPGGRLTVQQNDEVTKKLLMLIEGECGAEPKQLAARVRTPDGTHDDGLLRRAEHRMDGRIPLDGLSERLWQRFFGNNRPPPRMRRRQETTQALAKQELVKCPL
jgi:hypothetical protein